MNTITGEVISHDAMQKLPPGKRKDYVPIVRDLTHTEKSRKQIELYSPCGCGSGKKFKFCCHRKPQT